jgi:hypothetical protein
MIYKKSILFIFSFVFLLSALSCIHDPVDEDYYLDINKVHGIQKPEPPPVINTIVQQDVIVIDFSGTTTIDPDTGNADGLYYLVYASQDNPAYFSSELMYYDGLYYLGYVAHQDLTEGLRVRVDVGDYRGDAYFWMTAYDGGRESDHSNVVYILIQ